MAIAISVVNGLVQASALTQLSNLPPYQQILMTVLFQAQAVGSIATSIGYQPLVISYIVPVVGGIGLAWSAIFAKQGNSSAAVLLPFLSIGFGFILVGIAGEMHRVFRESFAMRLAQAKLSEQLRKTNDDLLSQQQALQIALNNTDKANKAKTRFLASASHDLRQPLHALALLGASMANRPLDSRTREIAVSINEAMGQLTSELDALLDISKLDAGIVTPQFAPTSLGRTIDNVRRVLGPYAEQKAISLQILPSETVLVRSDGALLERVIRNLVDNAIKYTQKGNVSIEYRVHGSTANVEIRDTGIGIPTDQLETIFEEFYQVENPERDRSRGLGLGLSIVRRLCHILGHQITVKSILGGGTTIQLQLPLDNREPLARLDAEVIGIPNGLRVLVLDDERQVRVAMKTLFEEWLCEAELASSTDEAVAAATARQPDLIIADLRLRNSETGVAAVELIRKIRPNTPALLISGDTSPMQLLTAHNAKIPLLHKPVPFETLCRAIRDVLAEED